MKEYFFSISEKIMNSIASDEHLNLSINGENSEFIRINNAKVRQIGTVSDTEFSIELIKNNRKIGISFTLQRNPEKDLELAKEHLHMLRNNIDSLQMIRYVFFKRTMAHLMKNIMGSFYLQRILLMRFYL